jgi:hypothetical protein
MADTELLLSLAEIAGVFVGFGALIAVRSGDAMEGGEVSSLRWVMSSAIWVVTAALAPIFISLYGVAGHGLWLGSSLLGLLLFAVMIVVNARAPENLADVARTLATTPRTQIVLVMGPTFWLPTLCLVVALGVVALGRFPGQEQALYLTAVGLGLFMGAIHLFVMVFWQRRSSASTVRGGLPGSENANGPSNLPDGV